jgi:hypothetical protein
MSKGKGGGGHGGGTGVVSIRSAVAAVNAVGLGSKSVLYSRTGMKGSRKGAFAGATRAKANAIATGRAPTRDWGKTFEPVRISVEYKRPGGKAYISLEDGRHRMLYAKRAGATMIRAQVSTSTKINGKWVDGKTVTRNVRL